MITREVDYKEGDAVLRGFLAAPDGAERLPAVLVAHAWGGRDAFACQRARDLAELGYTAFALDVYGAARLGSSTEENLALMTPFQEDREYLRRRLLAAVDAASAQPEVDGARLAAIGYCFGGLCVLDLARCGAPVRGVVSFHGLFAPPGYAVDRIEARVLALHGHEDPMVPPEAVLAFEQEMTAAGADWQVHVYGGTYHGFTNPEAKDPALGAAFDPSAERRSWLALRNFLSELFD